VEGVGERLTAEQCRRNWFGFLYTPFAGNLQLIFFRNNRGGDTLVQVLLNGREARLPIETDCAPYYHWHDVKRYYLRKLYRYEKIRNDEDEKKK